METCYLKLQNNACDAQLIEKAAAFIKKGETVAFPTETVYGLGANGLSGEAVRKIFAAKGRPGDNPLILHIADIKGIGPLTKGLTKNAAALINAFWPGPLTVIVEKSAIVPSEVSAELSTVGVRFPSNETAMRFIKACGCPIAAPSANLSGKPSPTNAADVLDDMQSRIAAVLDGGSCSIGVESTVVDTTTPVPVILRPGGITFEMLTEVLEAVEIDAALAGDKNFKPKAPGMKYRHYAPKAPMYLLDLTAVHLLPSFASSAIKNGLKAGILCSSGMAEKLPESADLTVASWGTEPSDLAAGLFHFLRNFDRTGPDVILAEGVDEKGMGLTTMNRMKKAAGDQIVSVRDGRPEIKNGAQLPDFIVK
ncbi:MAG: threonylcarbamoyl-AMP synthase [Phascolarctobacterium sp.]|nr:threonylcarbamoyl-AMP synthase [Phascolarctobacterium sp.]